MAGPLMAASSRGLSRHRWSGCALLFSLLAAATFSFAAPPEIESFAPRALRSGIPTEIKFSGTGLSEATNVWANFPATFESLGNGRFRITPAPYYAIGISALRLHGASGVSLLCPIMFDDLPTVPESRTNKSRASAQRVEPGSAVEGNCDEISYDWFRVRGRKGQRIALEVVASRLGSRLDSVLRVVSSAGKLIAQNDDVPGLRGDSYIQFMAASDADYFIELRDVNYGGGSEFFYRLRVGDFALATTAYPAVTSLGSNTTFQLAGPAGEVGRTEARPLNASAIQLAVRGANGSTFAKAQATSLHQSSEREPNDVARDATKVAWTNGINGRFGKANDVDFFAFSTRKGERLEFRAATRSLGSPCDAVLEIQSADGKILARSNPTAEDEGVVSYKFASNGVFRLRVEEANGAFGPNCVYHITASRSPGYALTLDTDRYNAVPGKSFDLKVNILRSDYKGAVTLALDGIDSLQWTNAVIGEGKSNATMKITVPESLAPGMPNFFAVTGTTQRDGAEVQTRASTAPALRRRFPQMLYVPIEWDGEVTLGIVAP